MNDLARGARCLHIRDLEKYEKAKRQNSSFQTQVWGYGEILGLFVHAKHEQHCSCTSVCLCVCLCIYLDLQKLICFQVFRLHLARILWFHLIRANQGNILDFIVVNYGNCDNLCLYVRKRLCHMPPSLATHQSDKKTKKKKLALHLCRLPSFTASSRMEADFKKPLSFFPLAPSVPLPLTLALASALSSPSHHSPSLPVPPREMCLTDVALFWRLCILPTARHLQLSLLSITAGCPAPMH